jgi:hypothetical protein
MSKLLKRIYCARPQVCGRAPSVQGRYSAGVRRALAIELLIRTYSFLACPAPSTERGAPKANECRPHGLHPTAGNIVT